VAVPVWTTTAVPKAGLDGGAQENAVGGIGDAHAVTREVSRSFLDRQRFARESRLAHLQVLFIDQPGIRRRQVTGVKLDDVPGHEIGDWHLLLPAISDHRRLGGDLASQFFHRAPRLEGLVEVHEHAEQHDGDDDQGADTFACGRGDDSGAQEDQDEWIGEKAQDLRDRREARLARQAVGAEPTEPVSGLSRREPLRRSPKLRQQLVEWDLPKLAFSADTHVVAS
jgi:hypothetical protein